MYFNKDFEAMMDNYSKYPFGSKEYNIWLTCTFPYLYPRDKYGEPLSSEDYDFSYTILDEIPAGWRELIIEMCFKINKILEQLEDFNEEDFYVSYMKEKFGLLRVGVMNSPSNSIIYTLMEYETKSGLICQVCGEKATHFTLDWLGFYCETHVPKGAIKINEYHE